MSTHGTHMDANTHDHALTPPLDAAPNKKPPLVTATSENSRCCIDTPGTKAHPPRLRQSTTVSAARVVAASTPSSSTKYLLPNVCNGTEMKVMIIKGCS